jgi:hypothetical protein
MPINTTAEEPTNTSIKIKIKPKTEPVFTGQFLWSWQYGVKTM